MAMDGQRLRRKRQNLILGAGLGVGASLGMPAAAQADVDTVVVDSAADPGDGNCATNGCTLREAIAVTDDTDPLTDVDQITFQAGLTGTITLNGTQLPTIDEPLTIQGPGAGSLAVSGNDTSRIIYAITLPGADVTISDLTLRDGRTTATPPTGATGGAIKILNGDLTVEDAVITGSDASITGVGYAAGGGVFVTDGSLTLRNTTVSGNSATGYTSAGGGVSINAGSSLTIENSTVSGNTANGNGTVYAIANGGGIYSSYTDVTTVTRSTVSGNSAGNAAGSLGIGGGISTRNGPVTIQDTTVSGNSVGPTGAGGGIRTSTPDPDPDPVITNTIVANNSAPGSGPDLLASASNESFQASFSLIENPSGGPITETVAGSNITGVDPQLGPLSGNGGPTETHRPAAGSPVIDKGSSLGPADQRGLTRPVDQPSIANSAATGANGADIGAVELQAAEIAGQIEIEKQTLPDGDSTQFSFTAADLPGTADDTFSLSDDGVRTVMSVPPGDYEVSEDGEAGFDLTGLTCNDGASMTPSTTAASTATIQVDPGETVRCTFTNTKRGQIEIEKQTVPNGDPTPFSFTATDLPGTANDTFSLSDNGVKTIADVLPGEYDVSEDAAAGFDLTGLTCNDGASATPSTTAGRIATVNLDPGETVRCVFTNTKQAPPTTTPVVPPAVAPKKKKKKCKKKKGAAAAKKKCKKKK